MYDVHFVMNKCHNNHLQKSIQGQSNPRPLLQILNKHVGRKDSIWLNSVRGVSFWFWISYGISELLEFISSVREGGLYEHGIAEKDQSNKEVTCVMTPTLPTYGKKWSWNITSTIDCETSGICRTTTSDNNVYARVRRYGDITWCETSTTTRSRYIWGCWKTIATITAIAATSSSP